MKSSEAGSHPNKAEVLKASSKALLTALSLNEVEVESLLLLLALLWLKMEAEATFEAVEEAVTPFSRELSVEELGALLVLRLWKNFLFRSALSLLWPR